MTSRTEGGVARGRVGRRSEACFRVELGRFLVAREERAMGRPSPAKLCGSVSEADGNPRLAQQWRNLQGRRGT